MKKAILAACVILTALLLIGGRARHEPTVWEEYTVMHGDTVSGIAREITPNSKDYRYTMYDITEKNGIENAEIYPGQVILVPIMKGE